MLLRTCRSGTGRRLIGAGVLLFVFFLPLHFHFSTTAQLAHECACVQGTRVHMGLAPAQIFPAPPLPAVFVVVEKPARAASRAVSQQPIRSPPFISSL
ncbi:MAG TPA: hypothetical protein VNL14_13355 [Candidatus Acidoferrales bacterium]|nr:hypothetical protein [Candidatus Acidoferrales bacterium]